MTSGQKIAFSLLITLLLFTGFTLTVKNQLFEKIETRFYAQSKIHENVEHLDSLAESSNTYITNVLYLIEKSDTAYLKNEAVRSFYMQNPSEREVSSRRQLTEELFKSIPSLSGLRIIDKNGRTVHYSTYDESDILKQSGVTKFYKYYNDIQKDADELPFDTIKRASSESESRILYDEKRGRLILSVPFFWIDDLYSGLGLFYLDVRSIERALGLQGVLDIGETISLYSDEKMTGFFVADVPAKIRSELGDALRKMWNGKKSDASENLAKLQFPEKLLEMEDGRYWVSLSDSGKGQVRISGVYTSDTFEISKEMELVIYIALFLTVYLILFLIFSLFGEPVSKMKKRIKKMQYSLISDFIESKDKLEWENAVNQLRNSRADMSAQIMKGFRVRSKKKRRELSEYLDSSWNEIIAAMESRLPADSAPSSNNTAAPSGQVDQAMILEMRRMMEKVLFEIRSSRSSVP
ncbi:MAG: cache domain-containing protein, partial [Treponema sp.]|nr:cache domain-containing protein [Treponema sp.]